MCTVDDRQLDEQYNAAAHLWSIHIGATAKVNGWNEEHKREVTADIMIQANWGFETTDPNHQSFDKHDLGWFEAYCELVGIDIHSNHIIPDWVDGEDLTTVRKRAIEFNWDLDDHGQEY